MDGRSSWLMAAIACGVAAFAPVVLGKPALPADATVDAIRWQLALEREGFSPGLIDGRIGGKTVLATEEFQRARGLAVTGRADPATAEALLAGDAPVLTTYAVQAADLEQVTGVPSGWVAKSGARRLGYGSLIEALAEKHHCSQNLLRQLNSGTDLSGLRAGRTLVVPALGKMHSADVNRLEINLTHKTIRAFDRQGRVVGLFHCSVAAHVEKRPKGTTQVVVVAKDPSYCFDPVHWPEVKGVQQKLLIPPGPRSPVGVCWIGLGLRGYGIHGTPNPELIGKTGSHGCIRLTNWDAARLGGMVRPGVAVTFVLGDVS